MEQNKYDKESVMPLLEWAKTVLETKDYPVEKYQVNQSTVIADAKIYLEASIAMITRNMENPVFHPIIEHLREYKESWESHKKGLEID